MERRKRKVIASLLDNSRLHRLPKFGVDKLSNLVGSQTPSRANTDERSYSGPDEKRCSRLDLTAEDLGGSGLNIDLRSLEAFRDADNSWFGHDPAAQGGRQGQRNNKSNTPIADQFSTAKGEKGNSAALQVDKALSPRAPPPKLPGSPNGRIGRQPYVAPIFNETAFIESLPKSTDGRSVSVLERQRGVRPRLSKEKLDPSIEPVRIKLATTSQPADLQMPRSPVPTRKTDAGQMWQPASTSLCQSRFAGNDIGDTPTGTSGPKLSGVSVKAHIRRCSQHHNQIANRSESASKHQSMPASMPGSLAGRSTVPDTRDSLHSISKAAGLPESLRLTRSISVARPPELPRHTWSAASPTKVATSSPLSAPLVPGHDVRRHASTRVSDGKRLAWIKELEERKESKFGLNRELPVLRKMEGSVADKLARFERLAQQPDDVTALQRVTRTRSDSISSQRSFLTSAGSRPASWYQSGSTIATTARTSTDSHRPPSVLLNYNETFREKMQIVAGKYNKLDRDRDQDRESEDSQTLEGQTQSGEPDQGDSGLMNPNPKIEDVKGLKASGDIQTTITSSNHDCVGQSKPPETPGLAPENGAAKDLKFF